MDKKQERLLSQAANAKLVHLNEQLIFPLLDRNCEQAIASLCDTFKSKGLTDPSKIAYIAACRDLKIELEAIARQGDRAVAVLHQGRIIE